MDPILETMKVSSSGMSAQTLRLRVISENVANAQSTGTTPGADPYQRKTVTFQSQLDKISGAEIVALKKVGKDKSDFPLEYSPSHPAANAQGFVKMPNVNTVIEMADMREASRGFEANATMVEQARAMLDRTIDLLK